MCKVCGAKNAARLRLAQAAREKEQRGSEQAHVLREALLKAEAAAAAEAGAAAAAAPAPAALTDCFGGAGMFCASVHTASSPTGAIALSALAGSISSTSTASCYSSSASSCFGSGDDGGGSVCAWGEHAGTAGTDTTGDHALAVRLALEDSAAQEAGVCKQLPAWSSWGDAAPPRMRTQPFY
jgi:hypothetical protein